MGANSSLVNELSEGRRVQTTSPDMGGELKASFTGSKDLGIAD